MITPAELLKLKFSKAFRGYNEAEVNDFIIRISQDFEKMARENQELKQKLVLSEKKLAGYSEMEGRLKSTLVSAQKTHTEIKDDAQRKSEIILREAELNAERIVEDARQEVKRLTRRITDLKHQKASIGRELREVIARYQQLLEIDDETK